MPGMPSKKKADEGPKTIAAMTLASREKKGEDPDKLKVEMWINDKGIREALATYQDVLWEGKDGKGRWKPVAIGDLNDTRSVDKAYRKACLLVHPDKIRESHPHYKLAQEILVALSKSHSKLR